MNYNNIHNVKGRERKLTAIKTKLFLEIRLKINFQVEHFLN